MIEGQHLAISLISFFTFNKHLSSCVDGVINCHNTMTDDIVWMLVSTTIERLAVSISIYIQ